jgi:hypothetical protein
MNETHKVSLIEAANQSGIPVEEIHARVFRGDLPGDGNIAMPGNRNSGFVNARTLERLITEGRGRHATGTHTPAPGIRFHVYMTLPIDQAAAELGMSVRDVELLLVNREMEGSYCYPRWVGVKHQSLANYKDRLRAAAYPDVPSTNTQDATPTCPDAPKGRFKSVLRRLTGGSRL